MRILLTVFTLMGIGLVLVYSSSFIFATESFDDGLYFFKKQILFSLIALGMLFFFAMIRFELLKKLSLFFWILLTVGLVLTLVPGVGVKIGGANRWVQVTSAFRFEPSEFLKILVPFMVANLAFLHPSSKDSSKAQWVKIGIFLAPFFILLKQPDFGSIVVCTLIVISLLFIFGLKWRFVVSGILTAASLFYFLVITKPYRLERVMTYLDPWSHPEKGGYQVIQSLLSFYSGGLMGTGLGQGQAKLFFLPEAHTDFALSVLGEEVGFVGVFIVLLLYGILIIKTFQIGTKLKDPYAQCVTLGLGILFSLQVFINAGVVLGLLPTKGLTLPFLSYGGSSLIATCSMFGILLNADRSYN